MSNKAPLTHYRLIPLVFTHEISRTHVPRNGTQWNLKSNIQSFQVEHFYVTSRGLLVAKIYRQLL